MRVFYVSRRWLITALIIIALLLLAWPSIHVVTSMSRVGNVIVIDPGHGGIDPGAYISGQLAEEELVLDVSQRIKSVLGGGGRAVSLTRNSDRDVASQTASTGGTRSMRDLSGRVRLIHDVGGAMFISIHANYYRDTRVRGPIVFYRSGSQASARLAQAILTALTPFKPQRTAPVPGDFYVLRNSRVPAVLVELGFISNPQERALLLTSDYRSRIATAIAGGVNVYLSGQAAAPTGTAVGDGGKASPAAPAVAADSVEVLFPLRDRFGLAASASLELALPASAATGGDSGVELVARSVMARLLAGPNDPARFSVAAPAGTVLRGLSFRRGTLTVDLSADVAGIPSASDEYLTVYALVNSLGQVPGVKQVQLLVEGQHVDTLAGHVDISVPLKPAAEAMAP